MKKIILLVLIILVVVGCYQAKAYRDKQIDLVCDYKITTVEYQGCEYVVMQSHYQQHGTLEHKGNCRFCKERRQKEMEKLMMKNETIKRR